MLRCQRKMVPRVTISRIGARRSIGTVPASRAGNARSGHVSRRPLAPGNSQPVPQHQDLGVHRQAAEQAAYEQVEDGMITPR
jgi:hypothetical protein